MDLSKIEQVVKPLIESSGFTLYDLDFQGRTLRVCIQKVGGGVSIQDCVETSRLLNAALDVEDVVPGGSYDLEVSSPGLDRDLKRPEHFQGAIGEVIHVITMEPLSRWNQAQSSEDKYFEKRKKIKGELIEFKEDKIGLNAEGRDVSIPLSAVSRAYVDFEVIKQPKKKFNKGSKK